MTLSSGTSRYFKCPYQANVMKMLEMVSNTIVVIVSMLHQTALSFLANALGTPNAADRDLRRAPS